MKHVWTVFCGNVLENKRSGTPSLVDVTERIGFSADLQDGEDISLPLPFPFFLVSCWWKDDQEDSQSYQARIRFLSPDGKELRNLEFSIKFEKSVKFHTLGEVRDLPFTRNGSYVFEVEYLEDGRWMSATSIPLEIVHENPETKEQAGELTE